MILALVSVFAFAAGFVLGVASLHYRVRKQLLEVDRAASVLVASTRELLVASAAERETKTTPSRHVH